MLYLSVFSFPFHAERENEVSPRILRLDKNNGGEVESTSTITQETSTHLIELYKLVNLMLFGKF